MHPVHHWGVCWWPERQYSWHMQVQQPMNSRLGLLNPPEYQVLDLQYTLDPRSQGKEDMVRPHLTESPFQPGLVLTLTSPVAEIMHGSACPPSKSLLSLFKNVYLPAEHVPSSLIGNPKAQTVSSLILIGAFRGTDQNSRP